MVCDDGPDQQIKFYDISGARPKLAGTFGDKGGLRSGTPGLSSPTKLYSPRGAGTDAAGNLYIALGFNGAPVGTFVLRSFTPDGKLRWELANHAFVDTYGFDPASDGKVIYSRTAVFDLDLASEKSGLITCSSACANPKTASSRFTFTGRKTAATSEHSCPVPRSAAPAGWTCLTP